MFILELKSQNFFHSRSITILNQHKNHKLSQILPTGPLKLLIHCIYSDFSRPSPLSTQSQCLCQWSRRARHSQWWRKSPTSPGRALSTVGPECASSGCGMTWHWFRLNGTTSPETTRHCPSAQWGRKTGGGTAAWPVTQSAGGATARPRSSPSTVS